MALLAIACIIVLVAIGMGDQRAHLQRSATAAVAASADKARAILDHQRDALAVLARLAAAAPDATIQRDLDRVATSAPGTRAAAIADAAGGVQLRSKDGLGEAPLAALAADAAKQAATRPDAPLLATQTLRDDASELVGLALPWCGADGAPAGIALVVIDPSIFAGIDLARLDGAPLFAGADSAAMQEVALGDYPLMLRYSPPAASFWSHDGGRLFIALGVVAAAATLGLLALLVARLVAAGRAAARNAATERQLRDRLAVAEEAANRTGELSRAKSQFFAQVTHELRTPLNAILGFSETIRQEMFGPVANPRYLEYAGLIHDAGGHLLSLINDLLDEARIEAGKMEIAPIRVAAPALARSALDLVELLAEGRDIAVTTTGLSSCPDLNVDPRAMKQVLVNLLSNAIKYTSPGGRIDLRFAKRDDDGVTIEIADTGIGMSEADLRVAFEPFGRTGGVEARRQQGTGLGLSLARALVRLHGGELTLQSAIDTGTTATVTLPASAVFAAPRTVASAKAA